MKKPTMIIGKKQIILAGMTLILGLAVYINYAVSTSDGKIKATDVVKSQSVNYGDAQLVSTDSTSDYFAQARIDRMNSRDEAVETLKNIMNGGDSTEEEKKVCPGCCHKTKDRPEKEYKDLMNLSLIHI